MTPTSKEKALRTLTYDARPGDLLVVPPSKTAIASGSSFEVDKETADRLMNDPSIPVSEYINTDNKTTKKENE